MHNIIKQKTLNKVISNKKNELGVGFGGEPESKKKLPPAPSMRGVPMRNDAQAFDQYPKGKALSKAKKV